MVKKSAVQEVVFKAIDVFNAQMGDEQTLPKEMDAFIFGKRGHLSSLGLVNFVMETEEKISDEFRVEISLADEKAMSRSRSPFRTVESLVDYIHELLIEKSND